MSAHLVISGITDNEPVHSVQVESDGKTFVVAIDSGNTGTALYQSSADGRAIELVGLVTDNATWELKNVYVTNVQYSGDASQMTVTLAADEVRQA